MPFCNTYANTILNWIFSKGALTPMTHSKVYIGLSTNDPEASKGAFIELTGDTYTRVLISQYGAVYPDVIGEADNRKILNTKQVNWAKAEADWPRVNGFGLFTDETDGSPFFYGALDLTAEQKNAGGLLVEKGAVALFDPEALNISFPTTDVSTATVTTTTENT